MARSQFSNAWAAITTGNASNFNKKYGPKRRTRRANRKNRKTRRVNRRSH